MVKIGSPSLVGSAPAASHTYVASHAAASHTSVSASRTEVAAYEEELAKYRSVAAGLLSPARATALLSPVRHLSTEWLVWLLASFVCLP